MPASNVPAVPVASGRPVIAIDGQSMDSFLQFAIIQSLNSPSRCEVTFANWGPVHGQPGFLYFDRKVLDFGKHLTVHAGLALLFDGISALKAGFPQGTPPTLTAVAEDRLQDLAMGRRNRTFEDVSDADLFRRIAGDHGLQANVNVSGPTHKVVAQLNQTDLDLLRERALAAGAEFWVDGVAFHAAVHAGPRMGAVTFVYGGNLREFVVSADLSEQRTALSVNGWDPSSKSAIHAEATDAAITGELSGGISGAAILGSAFGARPDSAPGGISTTMAEAQALSRSLYEMNARKFVTGQAIADAEPRLRVGSWVDLEGIGPLFKGKYFVTEVQHVFDTASGFRSVFSVQRPGIGRV